MIFEKVLVAIKRDQNSNYNKIVVQEKKKKKLNNENDGNELI